jgi:hypothetical protein
MATADRLQSESNVTTPAKEAAKQLLLARARLGLELTEKGINYNAEEIRQFQDPFEQSSAYHRGKGLTSLTLPHGFNARYLSGYARYTPYSLVVEDKAAVLYDDGNRIG